MLNIYNYYTDPKKLPAPGGDIVKEWKQERDEKMSFFMNDLWELQDDYDVQIAHTDKPNCESWFTVRWGRDRRESFYIPAETFIAWVVSYSGQHETIYSDPHDIINMLADEMSHDGAFRQDDDEDDYEIDYGDDDDD